MAMARRTEIKSEEDLELLLARLLAVGVWLSAAVTAAGLIWFLVSGDATRGGQALDLGRPHPAAFPHLPLDLVAGVGAGNPLALVGLGLFLLILTPVARVFISIVLFARERDRLYTAVCTFVLAMLLLGMWLGTSG